MGNIVANPDELRKFAQALKAFNSTVEQEMKILNAKFSRLGETWRDNEHRKFSEEFKLMMGAVNKFNRYSKPLIPNLLKKAKYLEEYLNR